MDRAIGAAVAAAVVVVGVAAVDRPPAAGAAAVDVLVVGGAPPGLAAAVAAARRGRTVLLVESREAIGGDITLAWLNMLDLNRTPRGQLLAGGLFALVYQQLGQTFDIGRAQQVFDDLVRSQPRVLVRTRTAVVRPLLTSGALAGAVVADLQTGEPWTVRARQVIDASDDGALAAASGVPFTVGREDGGRDRRTQAATLIFRLSGVDPAAVARYIAAEDVPHRRGGVRGRYAWGYSQIARRYVPSSPRLGLFDLNLGWQGDGTVLVNALQIFDVDGTDPASVAQGRALAEAELPAVVAFLRETAPGFAAATLVGAAPHLYIRETRHTIGLYRMTADDIMHERVFPDRIAVASYPMDLHPYARGQPNLLRPVRRVYTVPFRALVARGADNLMVVGKALSATHLAWGSLRIIPTGMALGEAAGEAAALALEHGVTPARLAADPRLIGELQRRLVAAGAYLPSGPRRLSGWARSSGSAP
ncbi:MAG: FAD-dependent oxidoreductase [Armatimonadota bacterium]|nr:FAD-dependent oxidoreductase [Armatimonadota bacterium]